MKLKGKITEVTNTFQLDSSSESNYVIQEISKTVKDGDYETPNEDCNCMRLFLALVDIGANLNHIQEGLIPTKKHSRKICFKLPQKLIYEKMKCLLLNFFYISQEYPTKTGSGTPFLTLLCPFTAIEKGIETYKFSKNNLL